MTQDNGVSGGAQVVNIAGRRDMVGDAVRLLQENGSLPANWLRDQAQAIGGTTETVRRMLAAAPEYRQAQALAAGTATVDDIPRGAAVAEALEAFVLVAGQRKQGYVYRPAGSFSTDFNNLLSHPEGRLLSRAFGLDKGDEVANRMRNDARMCFVEHVVEDPRVPTGQLVCYEGRLGEGAPQPYDRDAVSRGLTTAVNTYRVNPFQQRLANDSRLGEDADDSTVQPYLRCGLAAFGRKQFDILAQYLGFVLVEAPSRVAFVPVVVGQNGIGKNMMLNPVASFIGTTIGHETFASPYDDFLKHRFVVIDEVKPVNRDEFYNMLKERVQSKMEFRMINPKMNAKITLMMQTQFVITTNRIEAVGVSEDDRRVIPIISVLPDDLDVLAKHKNGIAAKLHNWLEEGPDADKNQRAVCRWLARNYDPVRFQAMLASVATDPQMQAAKDEMREGGERSEMQMLAGDWQVSTHQMYGRTIVPSREAIEQITRDRKNHRGGGSVSDMSGAVIGRIMRSKGFSPTADRIRLSGPTAPKETIWYETARFPNGLDARTAKVHYDLEMKKREEAAGPSPFD